MKYAFQKYRKCLTENKWNLSKANQTNGIKGVLT